MEKTLKYPMIPLQTKSKKDCFEELMNRAAAIQQYQKTRTKVLIKETIRSIWYYLLLSIKYAKCKRDYRKYLKCIEQED